jgi:hypothetical protein
MQMVTNKGTTNLCPYKSREQRQLSMSEREPLRLRKVWSTIHSTALHPGLQMRVKLQNAGLLLQIMIRKE